LQNPRELNEDSLSNVRREARTYVRHNERKYLKDKINELESNSKSKNIGDLCRGIKKSKKTLKPRTNSVKNTKEDVFAVALKLLIG
jgi:hypothetical protein